MILIFVSVVGFLDEGLLGNFNSLFILKKHEELKVVFFEK